MNQAETKQLRNDDWLSRMVYRHGLYRYCGCTFRHHINASNVRFSPGAPTAWHRHPKGQTLYVTEGVGRAQARGEAAEVIRPGDRVFFEPGEDHWHGAAPDRFMTHLSLVEVDEQGKAQAGVPTARTTSTDL